MPARHQPFDRVADPASATLHGAWLNKDVLGSGDAASDIGPDSYDMTRVGAPRQERVGMTFTAASSQYLRSVVGAPFRAADSAGTILAWIKLDSVGADQVIFASSDEGSDVRALLFRINAANRIEIARILTGFANDVVSGTTTTFVAGQWYRIAVVSTGTAYALYVNGQAEALAVGSGSNSGDWLADVPLRDNITIGAWRRTGVLNYFNGAIKDVRYHSGALI